MERSVVVPPTTISSHVSKMHVLCFGRRQFLVPWGRVGIMHPAAEKSELGRKLWTYLEEQVDDFPSHLDGSLKARAENEIR